MTEKTLLEPAGPDPGLLQRIADPSDPALRAKVLADLLDYPDDDPELVEARRRIPEQPWIRATLAAHNGDGTWGTHFHFYQKYRGTSWVLAHLCDMGAPGDLEPIQAGVRHLLASAKPVAALKGLQAERFSGAPEGVIFRFPAACLTARMARVLACFGHAAQPITRAALASCRAVLDREEGFDCAAIESSLQPKCFMTVPEVLKAFLALPAKLRTGDDRKVIADLANLLIKHELFRYVPERGGEFLEFVGKNPIGRVREIKREWIEQGRDKPRKEKAGWLRFSFPHSYNSDLLEVLLLLGEAGVQRDEVIDEGLRLVLSKRRRNGMWTMTGGLNGKMYADIDAKGKPSPWITFRALLAFKRFGLLVPG